MKSNILITVFATMTICQASLGDENEDMKALRALDQAYAVKWIEGDADGVMALFTAEATLVPHHGDPPIKGRAAIRNHWFNPDFAPTVVPEWQRDSTEVFVLGDVGVVRGRARLVWVFDGVQTTIPEGNYVIIAVRQQGRWLIRLLTWNDDPRTWLQEPVG